jgi:hypothetical protein
MTQDTEQTTIRGRSNLQKLWVPVILLIGLAAGELISAATAQPAGFEFGQAPNGMFYFHQLPPDPVFGYHVILTTIAVALLVSLVVIYARMYAETKANFALGLVVVLVALLLQAVLSYPIVEDLIITPQIEPGFWSPVADTVSVCAYTVFLYLSLE